MRAVIYLVSGVATSILLYPPPLQSALQALFSPSPDRQSPAFTVDRVPDTDSSHTRTALLRGTTRVATDTLLRAGLAPDALEKGADLDGDGDPDEIHLRLEVATLADAPDEHWAFVPKAFGLSQWQRGTAQPDVGPAGSPDLHIEQGDTVLITLENSHHLPLALLFDGVDAQPLTADGQPIADAGPALPGQARTYRLRPLMAGEALYRAQDVEAASRGLQGRLIVAENMADNTLVTVDTDWQLRAPSASGALAAAAEAPAMDAAALLQYSGFGLALGLALAGLGGLVMPLWSRRRTQEKAA